VEDFLDFEKLKQLAGLLAPGLLIMSLRSAVRSGPTAELKDRIFSYAAISAIYYAVVFPVFNWDGGIRIPASAWYLLQYFVLPFGIGLAAAYEVQEEWLFGLASKFKLFLAHPIPAAWDYAFSKIRSGTFVLVSLANGDQVAGLIGRNSFASSSREERDLLIERVWIAGSSGEWSEANPPRSILLCGRDIRLVEIF
jgi:hypothetical protein